MPKKILNVIYDLKFAPITHDFTTYLAWCESTRQIYGADEMFITIKANEYRSKTDKDLAIGRQEKDWRVKNVILDSCWLLPTITATTLLNSDVKVNAENYHLPQSYENFEADRLRYPINMKDLVSLYEKHGKCPKVLEAPSHAQHLIEQMAGHDFITLNLRYSHYAPDRNINLKEWYKFYNYLIEKDHEVLVVPDFEDACSKAEYKKYNWNVFLPACFDQRLRMALYGQAKMNFIASGGTGTMAVFSNKPYIVTDVAAPKTFGANFVSERQLGIPIGASPPWAGEKQSMIWEESTFATLVDAYDKFVA
ncbi:MAG: hypothetical protein RIC29_18540 [Rhodospirillaceae bacterium]